LLCVSDGVIRLAVPQPTEWQRNEDEIDAAMIFARVRLAPSPWVRRIVHCRDFRKSDIAQHVFAAAR
jgi:hypothetical protein